MFLDFDENRPETPRVLPALTRLERVLLVVVAYQLILIAYFAAPDSWVQPVKEAITQQEPIRFVRIEPLVERPQPRVTTAPPARAERPAPAPKAPPAPQPQAPVTRSDLTDRALTPLPAPPKAVPAPPSAAAPNEAPPAPRLAGGILGSARKSLDSLSSAPSSDRSSPTAATDQGADIQFDTRGIDFGPWLRRFRAQVIRNWFIPNAAEVLRGHVVIQMRVLRNGTLANIRVVQSSGIDPFDRAALTALRLSSPTLPLPDPYPLEAIDPFTVVFYYNEPIR